MEVKINLNQPPTQKVNVDLQWKIDVTKPKSGRLAKIFRKKIRVERNIKVTVTDISVPDDIVCDRDTLFSFLVDSQEYEQKSFPVDVSMRDMTNPLQLIFHPAKITDCKKPQDENPRRYAITFKAVAIDENGEMINEEQGKIDVIFEPLGVKPSFEFSLQNDEIQYSSSLKNEKVGTLASWVEQPFLFTPKQLATVSIKLFQGKKELPGLMSFADGSAKKKLEIGAGRKNVIGLPLYVDFSGISNPVDDQEVYTIEAVIVQSPAYSPNVKETIIRRWEFTLVKDQQGTELKVYTQKIGDVVTIPYVMGATQPFSYSLTPRSHMRPQVLVSLDNLATDDSNPRAGIYIKNLTISDAVQGNVRVIGEGNTTLEHFVTVDGSDIEAAKSAAGLFIPNGIGKKTQIEVSFHPSKIIDLIGSVNYDFKVLSLLEFDYWEDKDGLGIADDSTLKKGKLSILWNLHLEPNPEWLCVDYGSSAIVCRYDKDIINLKERKKIIFRTAEDGKHRQDASEENTRFLSSDIVLHTVRERQESTLCSQHRLEDDVPYLNYSVCLSPTSSLIMSDVRTQLPCLKILVGNEFLPEKPDYMTFKYSREKDGRVETVEVKDVKDEDTCLLRVSSIFKETYSELFRYFIYPESQGKNINKLVLTYPNTYTPAHLKVLENIAKSIFPKVRDGYLRFVSESDAVAAYYLQNWDKYNRGKNLKDDETVLVYDMGAGTLDITLARKYKNSDGKVVVDIIGKIGTGKAGNYLDYLIAEIMTDNYPDIVQSKKTVTTDSVPDDQTRKERVQLKQIIKEIIKPNLIPGQGLNYKTIHFKSDLILENGQFKQFMSDVTTNILSRLVEFINDSDLVIDTVLMSGRSCRLQALQDALRQSLDELGFADAKIVKFKSEGDEEKTVVVDGAMARAGVFSTSESPVLIRSKRLYASYGLIYKQLGGSYAYRELLCCDELPFVEDMTQLDDYDGPNCLVKGTSATDKIKLVQTYLSPVDTVEAYNRGDFELITEMEEYDMSDFGNKDQMNVKLRLNYKNNISLYVDGLVSEGSMPKGIDLASDITKKSIWPVTI